MPTCFRTSEAALDADGFVWSLSVLAIEVPMPKPRRPSPAAATEAAIPRLSVSCAVSFEFGSSGDSLFRLAAGTAMFCGLVF